MRRSGRGADLIAYRGEHLRVTCDLPDHGHRCTGRELVQVLHLLDPPTSTLVLLGDLCRDRAVVVILRAYNRNVEALAHEALHHSLKADPNCSGLTKANNIVALPIPDHRSNPNPRTDSCRGARFWALRLMPYAPAAEER